jgi:hypothetical protein
MSVYTETVGGTGVYLPDNYFIKTLIELGVVGLWFFIRLLAGAVAESRALERVDRPTDAALGIGTTAYLAASIFSMLFATYLELFPIDMHFWLLLGVVAATVRLNPVETSDTTPRSSPRRRPSLSAVRRASGASGTGTEPRRGWVFLVRFGWHIQPATVGEQSRRFRSTTHAFRRGGSPVAQPRRARVPEHPVPLTSWDQPVIVALDGDSHCCGSTVGAHVRASQAPRRGHARPEQ